jgi:hypothetical protein
MSAMRSACPCRQVNVLRACGHVWTQKKVADRKRKRVRADKYVGGVVCACVHCSQGVKKGGRRKWETVRMSKGRERGKCGKGVKERISIRQSSPMLPPLIKH